MSHQIFEKLCLGDLGSALSDQDHISLSPYLPYLSKLLQVVEGSQRVKIIQTLHKSSLAPTLDKLFVNDFTKVLSDAVKEQQLRKKLGSRREDSMLMPDGGSTVDGVFAGSDVDAKVRVIAAEVIYLQSQYSHSSIGSDLLSYTDYRELISAVLCVLCYRMPEVFDMKELLILLVHLTNDTSYYINNLVVNNPERYTEVLHCFLDLFVQSKGALEQKVLSYLRGIAALVSDSGQYVTLHNITNTRKRIVIQSLLASEDEKCPQDKLILSLFSERETATVIDFIKNESKVFEKLVRFSDFREGLIGLVSAVQCTEENIVGSSSSGGSHGNGSHGNGSHGNGSITSPVVPPLTPDKSKDPDDSFYCSFLDETIQEEMTKASQQSEKSIKTLTETQVARANHLLILYLNIVNTCRLSLQPRETRELVSLMLHKPPPGEEGDLFIKLSLSLFMSCTSLNSNTEVGNMIRRWLTELLNHSYEGGRKGELILLTGMHLYSGTYEMIGPILSQTTGLKINVSTGHAATIQTLWSQIQSEEQIVSALTNVPVTPRLSGLVTGYLPVHCISQLINSRAPACPPNLFTWLPQQLRETEEPVPAVLCELISGSVNFLMSNKGKSMTGISETELSSLLSPSNNMPCRVLAFYYLLLYRKGLSDLKLKVETQRTTIPLPHEYSVSLLGDDSAKTLLLHTRNNISQYSAVYPTFLKLLVSQFPFLCDPQELLAEDEAKAHVSKLDKNSEEFDVREYLQQIMESLERGDESRSYYLIRNMLKRHHEFIPSEIVAQCVPHVVKHGFRVQGSFILLWEKSAALNPQQTWLNTARTLVNPKLTEDDLWANPLQLFQIPEHITKSSLGVKILLHILKGYLSLCKARLDERDPPQANKAKEHLENKNFYLTLQNSAIVQLLLDLTSKPKTHQTETTAIEANHVYENSALIYNFLHDFFINNDGLSKLVCWQTFKLDQIEGVVNGVPSLHVACKFTTNMLQQPSIQKQLFAVCLLSYLAVQYPIQQTLQACNEMLQWAISQTSQLSTLWTLLSLESLVRISRAFPPLADPISRLLVIQKKLLFKYNANSIKHKLKVHSGDSWSGNPIQKIDEAFQKITTDILTRMKGS